MIISITACWDDQVDCTTVNNFLNGTDWEDPPAFFSFGTVGSKDLCKQECDKEPLCYAYSWYLTPYQNYKHCYGRGFGAIETLKGIKRVYCGTRLC